MRFGNKVAVISGGSQGIGEQTARLLSQEGASVVVLASSSISKAQAVVDALPGACGGMAVVCDVSDAGAVKELEARVTEKYGKVDILIAAAGVYYPTPLGETPEAKIDRMIATDLKGPWNLVDCFAPGMKSRRSGKIVPVASMCGVYGFANYAMYCAVKAGVIMMTKSLALDLAPYGININCVAPGFTATPMNQDIRTDPALKVFFDQMAERTPSGRTYSSAEEMARLIVFLASDDSVPMHGSCLLGDEGFTAGML